MIEFFKRRFRSVEDARSHESTSGAVAYDWIVHEAYEIAAAPRREGSGWRVAGAVSRIIDNKRHIHRFIRADLCQSREDAAQIALAKARQIVSEGGPRRYETAPEDLPG